MAFNMGRQSLEGRLGQKLFRGGLQLGKYLGATAVAASLLGCDHLPKPVSVSEDGRYIAYSASESGKLQPLAESYKTATMVLYDTNEGKIVNTFEINGPPIWPTNTGDTVAYMAAPEGEVASIREGTSVIVYSKGKRTTIEKAAYPELSSDGRYLAYTRILNLKDPEKASDAIPLILRERRTGKERNLGVGGMAADFSPDFRSLVYITFETKDKDVRAYVETLNLMSGQTKRLGEMNMYEGVAFANPRWINNNGSINRVIFSGKAKEGEDSEVFIATEDGGVTQVTNNNIEEVFFGMMPDGRVSYIGVNPEEKGLSCQIAKQSLMGWTSKRNPRTVIRIAGNQAILLGDDDNLYMTPVSNLENADESKIISISGRVKRQKK